jgi:glutamate dehydrogenase
MAELSKAIARLMEERNSQTPGTSPQQRQLLDRVRDGLPPGERVGADAFSRLLLARAAPEFLERTSDEVVAALCGSAYRFLSQGGAEPRVRVFNPEFERDGWDAPVTVVETLLADRPFVVDTVREALHRAGCVIRVLLHPVLGAERSPQGEMTAVSAPERSLRRESFLHLQIDPLAEVEARASLEDDLRKRLEDLVLATDDYQAMRQATALLASQLRAEASPRPAEPPAEEIADFLDWLARGNFVFLGYRAYELRGAGAEATIGVREGSGLGLMRRERSMFAARPRMRDLDPALQRRILHGPPVVLTKTSAESPVHRAARMDYIGVRSYDAQGRVTGERLLIGLLTSRAYSEESAEVPLLRRKLQRILEMEGAAETSHDHREIAGLFNTVPKEHLLAGTAEEIREDIRTIRLARPDEVRVTARADQLARGVFVLVAFPRESFSAELRRRIETMVKRASSGTVLDQHVAMEEGDHVRLHFYLATTPEAVNGLRVDTLQAEVRELLRTWDDRLRDALEAEGAFSQPRALARKYAALFSGEYKASTDVVQAVADIQCIEALLATGQPQVELVQSETDTRSTLKLYLMNEEVVLSDFLPVLENLGLRVFSDNPLDVTLEPGALVHLHSFEVADATPRAGERLDLRRLGTRLADALLGYRAGRMVDDCLNSLILSADLTWQQVEVIRTLAAHLVQGGVASRTAVLGAVSRQAEATRAVWDYFRARFDPLAAQTARERLAGPLAILEKGFLSTLDGVESIADDRILRALFATATVAVRTNAFHRRDDEPVAVKLEAERLSHLPRPRPRFEIFVHGAQMEGVHLRAGKVARGGLRLSDRADDYRTEVLDLMKTQVAKNAVIVPTGAKGGFHVRHAGTAAPAQTDIVVAYRAFIGALLSVTDNVEQGRVVPPPGILYDEPDPYLVVAADRGTATFSDTANEIALDAGFWLGDAFASGGSNGYDHKKIGITARGAWESVRRHFRELGRDADREPITVVGIGDMGGDVFGNGLLQSRHLRLRAAFNHRHVFLDPDPDPERAHAERLRLFALPRSSWEDYRREVLSAGGAVVARAAKRIPLSSEVRTMLGIEDEGLSGEELVRAVLRMEADLLWNGGIGTYVRASHETDADIGDASNDAVRVAASELRVRVVGEGGNLGFTHAARVEFALGGGRINADAIDNAGGVCMSDREVNLKILLGPLVEAGEIGAGDRNRLLTELAEEVTDEVLQTIRDQARALTFDQLRSQTRLPRFLDLIGDLEREGVLDRGLHGLPDKQALRRRRGTYLGLTRPELAVVLAHVKLHLQQRLLASSVPDDPYSERHLHAYFPRPVLEHYRPAVRNHRLRREIIAVQMANALVDLAGATFVHRIVRDTGREDVEVVRAWNVAANLAGLDEIVAAGDGERLAPPAEARLVAEVTAAFERACKWLLRMHDARQPIGEIVNCYLGPVFELLACLVEILPAGSLQRLEEAVAELEGLGMSGPLARRCSTLAHLVDFLEIAHLAAEMETPLQLTAETFYRTVELVDLDWVREGLAGAAGEDRWEHRAVEGLMEGLVYARRVLTHEILAHRGAGPATTQVEHCLAEYGREHEEQIEEVRALINDVRSAPHPTLAGLVVIMREVGRLCSRGD